MANCTNTVGSYACSCNSTYWQLDSNNRTCGDVKECLVSNGGCPSPPLGNCTERVGVDPVCSCEEGETVLLLCHDNLSASRFILPFVLSPTACCAALGSLPTGHMRAVKLGAGICRLQPYTVDQWGVC